MEKTIKVERKQINIEKEYQTTIIEKLNTEKGAYFCSSFEYPGRYTRWDIGFYNPPVEIRSSYHHFEIEALNEKGLLLVAYIYSLIYAQNYIASINYESGLIIGNIINDTSDFTEEMRSKQPSIFSLLRDIQKGFFNKEDSFIGLYGSFGYDLIFQFEKMAFTKKRDENKNDLVLFIPDELFIMDHRKERPFILSYDFSFNGKHTKNSCREPFKRNQNISYKDIDLKGHIPGTFAKGVSLAKKAFKSGDLFEVVPSQVFQKKTKEKPSILFERLKRINPSPYGFLFNMGEEILIGASPEMYVRVENGILETCPISGTIKRGKDPIEDSIQIKTILNSKKEESELTMCSDVDRNDKSRICKPGTVKVLGRRQIEMYSHLIHTVDHISGELADGFDGLDGFMTHMWAVTVTGAPKRAAIRWIEDHEATPRRWYGGAIGHIGFDGNINTGLILRTIHIDEGIANVKAGATLLYDSVPEDEEKETEIKAAALIAVLNKNETVLTKKDTKFSNKGAGLSILVIDFEDSFVHTLSSYFKETGASVTTIRHSLYHRFLEKEKYDLVILSPGPGKPEDYHMNQIIEYIIAKAIPIFGICLGMQGLIKYYGGTLGLLSYPVHGKPDEIEVIEDFKLFSNIKSPFTVGRYHSIYGKTVPKPLVVTAVTNNQIPMAIEHETENISAVQFHPESIMSFEVGSKIIGNIIERVKNND